MRRTSFRRQAFASSLLCLLVAGSAAAEPRLVLDGLSFFAFEGADASAKLPDAVEIPVTLAETPAGGFEIVIPAKTFAVPPVRYPSGRSVTWKLAEAARGTLAKTESGLSCTIHAPLVAHVEGAAQGIPLPMTFTTETSSKAVGELVATREGVRLDPASGYLQLVATGVNPEHALTAPGKPFTAVLSGRLLDLPATVE